jgi:CheY-like chemotaxis protein
MCLLIIAEYGGSGLGLFIARLLSRLQGGEIGVLSSTGHGSTFAFYISTRRSKTPRGTQVHALVPEINTQADIINSAPPAPHGRSPLLQTECSDITILIVEDNLVNQRVLQKQLHKYGFNVQIANNGQEALDVIRRSQFWRGNEKTGNRLSLILMDIEMPVMNGTEATRSIRLFQAEGSLAEHVPIIGITANARTEQIAAARESGMDDVVSKPFRIPELLSKIEMFIGPLKRKADGA